MAFVNWLAGAIARATADKVIEILRAEHEASQKISAVSLEAKDLLGELDAAQSESERKAILRKLSNFSDVSRLLLK